MVHQRGFQIRTVPHDHTNQVILLHCYLAQFYPLVILGIAVYECQVIVYQGDLITDR